LIFSELLRNERIKKELTMTELSNLLECGQSLISNWEAGKTFPHPKYYEKIKKFLNIDPKEYENNDIASEPVASYDIQRMVGSPKLSILDNMSEAQKNMAEAQINMTEAQLNMTKSNIELVEMQKELIQQNTVLTKKILEMMELNKG